MGNPYFCLQVNKKLNNQSVMNPNDKNTKWVLKQTYGNER